ncbi:unnamed protein product [Clonostachys rosea]|uniref:Protein kinase domain-containing protein n=1 Tax=Bionectria ochroleuca TaxID=29856 RepID=A0ABY6V4Y9_BIOOC|nr:unnamed protein product [Clonostachys rosea]
MPRHKQIPDLVHDSKIETSITGDRIEHVFYEPGRTPQERRRRRVESWQRDVVLGKGAYGIVYKEHQCGQGNAARAVKEISKCTDDGKPLDYMREVEAIIKFSHDNYSHCFVRSDGWFEIGDSIYITMEYMEHGDLQRHLSHPLPELEARQIVGQVLEGLRFMHDNGFVHRDLKPGNIMVVTKGPDWFVKIADFGISKRRQKGVTTLHTLQRGTLGFVAPEVIGVNAETTGGSYTFAVDIWSLGAMAHYILTHKLVFDNASDIVLYAMKLKEFPIAALDRSRASEKAKNFIIALLAAHPESRPLVATAFDHPWLAEQLTMKPQTMLTTSSNLESSHKMPTADSFRASGTWTTAQNVETHGNYHDLGLQEAQIEVETIKELNDNSKTVEDDSGNGEDDTDTDNVGESQITDSGIVINSAAKQNHEPPSVEYATDDSASFNLPYLPADCPFVFDENQEEVASKHHESEISTLENEPNASAIDATSIPLDPKNNPKSDKGGSPIGNNEDSSQPESDSGEVFPELEGYLADYETENEHDIQADRNREFFLLAASQLEPISLYRTSPRTPPPISQYVYNKKGFRLP